MNKQIMELWKKGFIEESNAHVSSNMILVKKPGSEKLRLCTNLVKGNEQIMDVDEPMPTLEGGLSKLGNKKFFSVIDLRQGFWQIPVDKKSRELLAFKTPSGLFQWTVMPFGLKTAPAHFTKAIRRLSFSKIWRQNPEGQTRTRSLGGPIDGTVRVRVYGRHHHLQ